MNSKPTATGQPLARFWEEGPRKKLRCRLCPRYCLVGEGQHGFCFTRQNVGGEMRDIVYGRPTGFAVDPIEKKPLYHFRPGSPILSFGTAGCNLGCRFCQNWHMSKARAHDMRAVEVRPEDVVELARQEECRSIAYTYNDPVVFAEFAMDTAKLARKAGLANVMVTAGYISDEARAEFYENVDAANVDLKAFSEKFYKRQTLSTLKPVLKTLDYLVNKTPVWVEITTLLIPGENDGDEELNEMCKWEYETLGPDVPIHFSAFHPDFKLRHKPPTPPLTLARARQIARNAGMRYVYTGNVADAEGQSTYCPSCGEMLIRRDWYHIGAVKIADGKCVFCGHEIAGVW